MSGFSRNNSRSTTPLLNVNESSGTEECLQEDFGSNNDRTSGMSAGGSSVPDPADEADDLKTKLRAAMGKKPYTFIRKSQEILRGASADAKRLIWEDTAFMSDTFFEENPAQLDNLLRQTDPVKTMELAILAGMRNGTYTTSNVVDAVGEWAKEFPSHADRAVTSGTFLGTVFRYCTGDDHLRAVQALIYHGEIPENTRESLYMALEKPDEEQFLKAWAEARVDEDLLKELQASARFFTDVGSVFSGTTLELVIADVRLAGSDEEVITEEHVKVAVTTCLSELDELNDFWVNDAVVVSALRTLDATLKREFPEQAEYESARNVARGLLHRQYKAYYGDDLEDRIESGLQGSSEGTALALVAYSESSGGGGTPSNLAAWQDYVTEKTAHYANKLHNQIDTWIYVSDANVGAIFDEADSAYRDKAVELCSAITQVPELVQEAHSRTKTSYDTQFGRSLVEDLHSYVQTEGIRNKALTMLGDRFDPTMVVAQQALAGIGDASTDEQQVFADKLVGVQRTLNAYAQDLWDAVNGHRKDRALGVATKVQSLIDGGADLIALSGSVSAATFWTMMEAAYQPLGGDLKHSIQSNFSYSDTAAQELFDAFQLGNVATMEAEESGLVLTEEQAGARSKALRQADTVFRGVENLDVVGEHDTRSDNIQDLESTLTRRWVPAVTDYNDKLGANPPDLYLESNGITLQMHLGLKLRSIEEREKIGGVLGISIAPLGKTRKSEAQEKNLDPDQFDFNIFETQSTFDLDEARRRAIDIHEEIQNNKQTVFELTQNGSKEELRVVREVFKELYGYDMLFTMREAQANGVINTDEFTQVSDRLDDAGQVTFATRLAEIAEADDAKELYKITIAATPAQKAEVLADGASLTRMREALSTEEWDRVYRTLTGQLTLGDALRTRKGWWWFGWGTDNEGMEADIKAYTAEIKKNLALVKQGEELDETFRLECLELWQDSQVKSVFAEQLSSEEMLAMEQLVIRGGERTGIDQVEAATLEYGNASELLDALKEMSTEERQQKRNDSRFILQLAEQLRGTQYEEAMSILSAEKGQDGDADLEKALDGTSRDSHAAMEAVLSMNTAELLELANDVRRLGHVRSRLTNYRDYLGRFDKLIADAKALGAADLGAEFDDDGKQQTDWTDEGMEQERKRIVLFHTHNLIEGLVRGRDDALAAAQKAYREKGEVTPCKDEKSIKVELFGETQRDAVFAAIEPELKSGYSHDTDFMSKIEQAVGGDRDPSGDRLDMALDGWDNKEKATAALENVGEGQLINEWSNIKQPGEDGRTLKQVYEAYQLAKDDLACKANPSDDDRHAVDVAHYKFVDFPLDVSQKIIDALNQEDNYVGYTTARGLLEFKQILQPKIVALPSPKIAKAIGMELADDYECLAEDSAEKKAIDDLNGTDRQARSMHHHIKQVARHQMTEDSLADGFTYSDEQMSLYWSHYAGAYGQATTKKDEETPFGMIDEDESAELAERRERFEVSVEEYKEAKSMVAEVMKWVAIAVIGAIATALTGPGGPTLIAAMVTAGIQAGASVAIDELVQGNDYDASTEGLEKIVTDVAMAGAGHKLNTMWEAAAKSYKIPGAIQSTGKWIADRGKEFDEAAKQAGFMGELVWDITKASGNVALGSVKDSAVSSLDLSELKYGWRQGVTNSNDIIQGELEGLPSAVLDEVIKTTIASLGGKAKDAVLGEDAEAGELPGVNVDELDIEAKNRDFLELLAAAGQKTLLDRKEGVLGEMWDQALDLGTGKVLDGVHDRRVSFGEDDISGFLLAVGKGRAEAFMGQVGQEAQDDRTSQLVADRAAAFKAEIIGPDADIALRHYVHHLKNNGVNANDGLGEVPTDFMMHEWKEINDDIKAKISAANLDANSDSADDYRNWALSDPTKSEERVKISVAAYTGGVERGTQWAERMRNTDGYKAMDAEQRAFYETYLSNPAQLFDFDAGGIDDTFDLGSSDGKENFEASFKVTKQAVAASIVPDVTSSMGEDDKRAFTTWLRTTGLEALKFVPGDDAHNKEQMESAVTEFQGRASGTELALLKHTVT